MAPGTGVTAIAVALLARLNPLAVIGSALFFGALEAGAAVLQRSYAVPSVTVYAAEALVILLIVAADGRVRSGA
jgi:simple sugar transport system permease protein